MLTPLPNPFQSIAPTCATQEPSSPRTLIVDGDVIPRGIHAGLLFLEDYEVEIADNGADALERLSTASFDLLLTGQNLSRMDGISLIRKLRASGNRIPVVMISGSLTDSRLPSDVANEIAVALPKPAQPAEIIAAAAFALNPDAIQARRRAAYAELLEQEAA